MNNEPVAWMHKDLKDGWLSCTNQHPETEIDDWLPLYTHPAKTLTDEEIIDEMKCIDWAELSVWDTEILKYFARAILRKAQEK